jgi:hypothetical protein
MNTWRSIRMEGWVAKKIEEKKQKKSKEPWMKDLSREFGFIKLRGFEFTTPRYSSMLN